MRFINTSKRRQSTRILGLTNIIFPSESGFNYYILITKLKKRTAEKWDLSDISQPLTNQHAIPLCHGLQWKSGIAHWLVRVEYMNCCHVLSKWWELDLESFVFFSFSLQRNSHDFEDNRKTILTETDQSLLSWEVSQPPPYAQKSTRCHRDSSWAARSHWVGSEFENQIVWL